MNNEKKKPVQICETVLRDAHQSLFVIRMTTEEMLPTIDKTGAIGYRSVGCWGGATFDSCLRLLHEDSWQRLCLLKQGFKNTKLWMLFRGQNILGYNHYADDVVEYFVQKSVANGIGILRIFGCLNDSRNLETAVNARKKEGAEAQTALSYTLGDVYTFEYWVGLVKCIREMGADSICVRDMSGLLTSYEVYDLVKASKESTKLPIDIHTHHTPDVAPMTLLEAIEAGIDIIDTAISSLAPGTSQPAMKVMVQTLKGTPCDTGPNIEKFSEIAEYLTKIREKYVANGLLNPKLLGINISTLRHQAPGGMLSSLLKQLTEAHKEDLLPDALGEVARARRDLGEPPLVMPPSQIVGTQAVMNVLMHQRYKMAPKESRKLVMGESGQSVRPVNPEIQEQIIGDKKSITCCPTDLIPSQFPKFEEEVGLWGQQGEDVLSYALSLQVALDFFKYRQVQQSGMDMNKVDTANDVYSV